MSKGSTPRPVDQELFDKNFERIFGKHNVKRAKEKIERASIKRVKKDCP
jgi:hypothetical protein